LRCSYRLKQATDVIRAFFMAQMLKRHDRRSPEWIRHEQRRRFRRLLDHAIARSPFYRDLYGDIRPEAVAWPDQLPVTDKRAIMSSFDRVVTDRRLTLAAIEAHLHDLGRDEYYLGRYRAITTSGSTGLRGTFVFDRREWATELANVLRWQHMIGVRPRLFPRVKMSTIGADSPLHVSRRLTESGDVGLFRVQQLSAMQPISELVTQLNTFQPEVLLPYASIAGLLAFEQIEGRLRIRPRVVSTHSEPLSPETARRVRRAWSVDALDHYGLTEISTFAAACHEHGSLHALDDLFIAELVDDDYRPVPAGRLGSRLLLTNLYNYTQPLIRYEVSDMLLMAEHGCACGRPFPVIGRIEGRREERLALHGPDGTSVSVSPTALTALLEEMGEIVEFRIAYEDSALCVHVVPRRGATTTDLEAAIRLRLHERLTALGAVPPDISIVFAAALEREPHRMGKVRLLSSPIARSAAR
jgi:phenylacetate-CoA ligase